MTTAAPTTAPAPDLGLRNQDFMRLWKGETISKAGTALTSVILPLVAIQYLNANTFLMGVLNASIWLPWLIVGLPAGVWADRLRAKPLMITCDIVAAVVFLTVPVAAWLGFLTMAQLLTVAVITGCASVFFTAAYNVYIPFLVGKKHIFQANARLHATESGAAIVGPGVGTLIAQVTGAVLGLVLDSLSFIVSALYLRKITVEEPPKRAEDMPERKLVPEILAAVRFIFQDAYMRVITVNVAAVNFCLGGVQALTLVFLVRVVGLGSWSFGMVLMAISIGGVLGSILAPVASKYLGAARALIVLNPISGTFTLLFGLADKGFGIVLCFLGSMLWSAGAVTNTVISASFRQAYCPYEMLGRVAAFSRTLQFGMLPIGSIAAGILGSVFDVRGAIWFFLLLNIVVRGILFIGPLKRSRDLPSVLPQ
jgi:MFS family permease